MSYCLVFTEAGNSYGVRGSSLKIIEGLAGQMDNHTCTLLFILGLFKIERVCARVNEERAFMKNRTDKSIFILILTLKYALSESNIYHYSLKAAISNFLGDPTKCT